MNIDSHLCEPLTDLQEKELHGTLFYSDRDEWKKRIILANVKFAVAYVNQFYSRADDREDMMQEGLLGLAVAAESFDPLKGVRFASYAGYVIMSRMRNIVPMKGSDLVGPATNSRTEAVLDMHFVGKHGKDVRDTIVDRISSEYDCGGWAQVDPAAAEKAREEYEEALRVIDVIEKELISFDFNVIKKAAKRFAVNYKTIDGKMLASVFHEKYVADKTNDEIAEGRKCTREHIRHLLKVIEYYLNKLMWSPAKYNDPDWRMWRELYSCSNRIEAINSQILKKQTQYVPKSEEDRKGKQGRKAENLGVLETISTDATIRKSDVRFYAHDLQISRHVAKYYKVIELGSRELRLTNTRMRVSGDSFYTKIHREQVTIHPRRTDYERIYAKSGFVKPVYTVGLPHKCMECKFFTACSSLFVNLKRDLPCGCFARRRKALEVVAQ